MVLTAIKVERLVCSITSIILIPLLDPVAAQQATSSDNPGLVAGTVMGTLGFLAVLGVCIYFLGRHGSYPGELEAKEEPFVSELAPYTYCANYCYIVTTLVVLSLMIVSMASVSTFMRALEVRPPR
jgi:hypothetical protein